MEDNSSVDKYIVYKSVDEIFIEKECYYDQRHNLIKEIEVDKNNNPCGSYEYTYDENDELVYALEKNPKGNVVARLDFKKD